MTSIADEVARAVLSGTKDYAAIKKKQERDRRQAERLQERYFRGHNQSVTIRDAAFAAMPEAYQKASGGGRYPANARQIMYAARPAIQELTGEALNDVYFTQVLLPDYIREHPDQTDDWDVVYDARGHLIEPHTGDQIGLGTLEVREYLGDMEDPPDLAIQTPRLKGTFPTCGPRNRYGSILYIEKEGFLPLLRQARFGERFDLAIMSSKGMSTTAARMLIENLSEMTTIFVLHDFDKAGFSILGTLTRDTRRYEFTSDPNVVDLGLRLADVKRWNLQSETVQYKADPIANLIENGATPDETAFLCESKSWRSFRGKRVELNAFTSDQFIKWLNGKLTEHRVKKVIPEKDTLDQAWRRAVAVRRYQEIMEEAEKEVAAYAKDLTVPKTLKTKLARRLAKDPALSWDQALLSLAAAKGW